MPSSVTPGCFSAISLRWNALVAAVVAASKCPVIASLGVAPTALSCCWMMPTAVDGPSPSLTRWIARALTYAATARLPTCRCSFMISFSGARGCSFGTGGPVGERGGRRARSGMPSG